MAEMLGIPMSFGGSKKTRKEWQNEEEKLMAEMIGIPMSFGGSKKT
jgi:glycine cleavage system pyridoxal-binding protein P